MTTRMFALMGTVRPTGEASWLGTKPYIIKLWDYYPDEDDITPAVEQWLLDLGVLETDVTHMLLDGSEWVRDNGEVIGIGIGFMETDRVVFAN